MVSPPPEKEDAYSPGGPSNGTDSMAESISSLPMPKPHNSDSDSGDDDSDSDTRRLSLGLILDHERTINSSIGSLAPQDRVEALQKNNQELSRRLVDAERTLQNRLADHEVEIEEMQAKLDELKSELTATKREEKELRNKEVSSQRVVVISTPLCTPFSAKTYNKSNYLSRNWPNFRRRSIARVRCTKTCKSNTPSSAVRHFTTVWFVARSHIPHS